MSAEMKRLMPFQTMRIPFVPQCVPFVLVVLQAESSKLRQFRVFGAKIRVLCAAVVVTERTLHTQEESTRDGSI